jgi:hypothetical protein
VEVEVGDRDGGRGAGEDVEQTDCKYMAGACWVSATRSEMYIEETTFNLVRELFLFILL